MHMLKRFAQDTSGATAIEYGLIAGLISVVIIGTLSAVGGNLKARFNDIATGLSNAGS